MKEEQKIISQCPFSLSQLKKIGNNDEEFVNTMLEKFIILVLDCSNNLCSALNKAEWFKLKSICHKNIPSYSLLGLNDIVILLKFIEKNAASEQKEITKYVELIFTKNNEVVKAINEYLILKKNEKLMLYHKS